LAETVLELGEALRMMEGAQQLTARARNATRGAPRPTSFKRRTAEFVDPNTARAQLEATLHAESHTPEVRELLRSMLSNMLAIAKTSPNMRVTFERFYGIENYQCVSGAHDDDLASIATYLNLARECAAEYASAFGTTQRSIEEIIRCLDPYDCPGFRFEM